MRPDRLTYRDVTTAALSLSNYLRAGFGVEDAHVKFAVPYEAIAALLALHPDLEAYALIARRYAAKRGPA